MVADGEDRPERQAMPNARPIPTLLLLLALAPFFFPAGAHAISPAPATPAADAAASPLGSLASAWDWLLSLVTPPEASLDPTAEIRLPTWNEGSHLDPNGGW